MNNKVKLTGVRVQLDQILTKIDLVRADAQLTADELHDEPSDFAPAVDEIADRLNEIGLLIKRMLDFTLAETP